MQNVAVRKLTPTKVAIKKKIGAKYFFLTSLPVKYE
jgi:hypothetical protein